MKILVLLILSRIFYSKQTHETRILFLNHSILLTQMKLKHTTLYIYIYIYSINPIIIFLVYMQKSVYHGQLQNHFPFFFFLFLFERFLLFFFAQFINKGQE